MHAVALGIAVAVLWSGFVRCPVAALFHVPCPSCGSTRAVRALVALDVRGAFHAHPVAPVLVVLVAILAVRWLIAIARYGTSSRLGDLPLDRLVLRLLIGGAALEIITWILRFFGMFGGPASV